MFNQFSCVLTPEELARHHLAVVFLSRSHLHFGEIRVSRIVRQPQWTYWGILVLLEKVSDWYYTFAIQTGASWNCINLREVSAIILWISGNLVVMKTSIVSIVVFVPKRNLSMSKIEHHTSWLFTLFSSILFWCNLQLYVAAFSAGMASTPWVVVSEVS